VPQPGSYFWPNPYYSSKATFESQGAILSVTDLTAYGTGVSVIGSGTSIGDLIFNTSPYGVVLGTANTFYPTVENVLVQPNFASVIIDVVNTPTSYNMFGLKFGTALGGNSTQFSVITNLATYGFSAGSPYIGSSLAFAGFVTTSPSEYITEIQAYSAPSFGGGAAVTDFELGTTAVVPEPGSITVMASAGLASLVMLLRRSLVRRERAVKI
jgi:hypothetical protein